MAHGFTWWDMLVSRSRKEAGEINGTFASFVLIALVMRPAIAAHESAVSAPPHIDSVTPDRGPIAGGTVVTLSGTNLQAAAVRVGSIPVTPTFQSASVIRFTMPPHANGIALIVLDTGVERTYGEFLYLPPPLSTLPPGHITTVAGIGRFLGDGRQATSAAVEPVDVIVDPDGAIVIVEESTARVRRIRPDGVIEPLVGTGDYGDCGDGGAALDACLAAPRAVARDAQGNLLIADLSQRVRRVDATTGVITTVAGTAAVAGFGGDRGPATAALLNCPAALAADSSGNIFVLDSQNYRIRRIVPDGTISTYAGLGEAGYSGDEGPATAARINSGIATMGDLTLDGDGNLYLADTGNGAVRKIERSTGIITTVVRHDPPGAIAFGPDGHLYVCSETADRQDKPRILRLDRSGEIVATYGLGMGQSPDGVPAATAPLDYVNEIAIEPDGDILFTEVANQKLRRIDASTGLLQTAAGLGHAVINEEGPALETTLHAQGGDLLFVPGTGMVLSDTGNFRLRVIDNQGLVHTLALTRRPDGPLTMPYGLEQLPDGSIVFGESNGVLRLDSRGNITVVAGADGHGEVFGGDGGPANDAIFCGSFDVAVERDGDILIADSINNRIRRIDAATGVITTVAGSGPVGGIEGWCKGSFCGDGGPAVEACLNTPYGVAVTPDGVMYIDDDCNARIRRVDPGGVIDTFVDGAGGLMTLDAGGNLYTGRANDVVRVNPGGITTVVAGTRLGFSGDGGPALEAQVSAAFPAGIAIDPEGNLFFRDGSQRIRAVRFGAVLMPPGAAAGAAGPTSIQGTMSVPLSHAFAVAVEEGGQPWPHVRVDFTAPATGSSCVFPNGEHGISVLTDGQGRATATCTPTCVPGAFDVLAAPLGSSVSVRFTVSTSGSSPTPALAALNPGTALCGHGDLELRVAGSAFSPCSVVLWDDAPRSTRFCSGTELRALIPAADVLVRGSHRVSVSTPAPGGGVSNSISFQVTPFRTRPRRSR